METANYFSCKVFVAFFLSHSRPFLLKRRSIKHSLSSLSIMQSTPTPNIIKLSVRNLKYKLTMKAVSFGTAGVYITQ